MEQPPLLDCCDEVACRNHYGNIFCRNRIHTFDGIRVYFRPDRFDHAFYESSNRDGKKDMFSKVRAQRMTWIKPALEHPDADLYRGYDKNRDRYDIRRRVCVVHEDFVVVIDLKLGKTGALKAEFVTCFVADNSIDKIRMSPKWSKEECLAALNRKGR